MLYEANGFLRLLVRTFDQIQTDVFRELSRMARSSIPKASMAFSEPAVTKSEIENTVDWYSGGLTSLDKLCRGSERIVWNSLRPRY